MANPRLAAAARLTPTRAAAVALFDGTGGASLAAMPVGVAAGTRVATPGGQVAVDQLRTGDALDTAQRVVAIPRRTLTAEVLAHEPDARPVHIAAGALGDGVPASPLLLAPGQLVLIAGDAIPAAALVNGESITRAAPTASVTYVGLRLDAPPLHFLAEGVSCGDIGLRPASLAAIARARQELDARLTHGQLSGHLATVGHAGAYGWLLDEAHPSARIMIELSVNGAVLGRALADRRRPDLLMAGIGDGHCGFDLQLHPPLPVGRSHVLRLRRADDGADLPGSPLLLSAAAGEPAALAVALESETAAASTDAGREDLARFLARRLDRLLQTRMERPPRSAG